MKAFVLCAGLGTRLRPFTYGLPKSSMPFLNLPLLSYGWFYLEQMGVSQFVLNSHLFPERLKKDIEFLKTSKQQTTLVIEKKIVEAGGGFYNVKNHFEEEKTIFYLNGDSLFFPSDVKKLKQFKEDFINSSFEASFFGIPKKDLKEEEGVFWLDKKFILKAIGSQKELLSRGVSLKDLCPVQFSGLALFKPEFLKHLSPSRPHIFWDVMNPRLKEKSYKVFIDEKGLLLEGGDEKSLLDASEFCLKSLFEETKQHSVKKILESVFSRFDPKDKKVGLQLGRELSRKMGAPLLLPPDVKGYEYLKAEGFAVIGSGVSFVEKSFLKRSVLGGSLFWKGSLSDKILISFQAEGV